MYLWIRQDKFHESYPDTERRLAQRINPQGTIELDASHASLASQSSAIAGLIAQAATALT